MASDGSGPDGGALLAYFGFLLSCAVVGHTFIVALFAYSDKKTETRIGLCMLAASALLLASPKIESLIEEAVSDHRYNNDPKTKTQKILGSATTAEFFKQFNEIPASRKDWGYMNDLKADLIGEGRLDILEQLEIKGLAIAEADREMEWGRLVSAATSSKKMSPEQRLKMYEWLFARGEPFKFSLKEYKFEILSTDNFLAAFSQVENPTSQKMFDLLIQHGASFKEKNPGYLVWYCARFGYLEPLKFLLLQKADPNYVDYDSSSMDEAIKNNYPLVVQALQKAGAKKASELKK